MYKVFLRYSNRDGYLLPVLFTKYSDVVQFCNDCSRRRSKVYPNLFGYTDPFMQYEVYDFSCHCVTLSQMETQEVSPVFVTEKLEAYNQR